MIVRDERAEDADAIRVITDAAFAGMPHSAGTEAAIVDGLRSADALTISLVADEGGAVLGHVAFSPVAIDGEHYGWFGLGPVSVAPARQRQGIGDALIRAGLARLEQQGAQGCVVLGDPRYYRRFGFVADPALRYPGVPQEYFQRLVLDGAAAAGVVAYHPAFDAG